MSSGTSNAINLLIFIIADKKNEQLNVEATFCTNCLRATNLGQLSDLYSWADVYIATDKVLSVYIDCGANVLFTFEMNCDLYSTCLFNICL